MKLFCAGFNLYGQFQNVNEPRIDSFKPVSFNEIVCDIEVGHAFSIIKTNSRDISDSHHSTLSKLYLHGFARGETHQIKDLNVENVSQISVADTSALFLTSDSQIWKLTVNDKTADYEISRVPNFAQIEGSEGDYVVKIACGRVVNCACTKLGYLYSIPTKLNFKHEKVRDLAAGREHCLILTEDGSVFSFGCGSRGQLGHGNLEDSPDPKLIDALGGIKISKISCGSWHCAVLSSEGDLYTWGWNSNGQLGLLTNKDEVSSKDCVSVMATPQVVDFQLNVTHVACGSRHTIVLLENQQLFGCGWNKYCQLGFESSEENHFGMKFLKGFSEDVVGLRCGPWNSVVLGRDN